MSSDIFRCYLRYPSAQRASDKTSSPSAEAAMAAFRDLLSRTDLIGSDVAAVMSKNGQQLHYIEFSDPEFLLKASRVKNI